MKILRWLGILGLLLLLLACALPGWGQNSPAPTVFVLDATVDALETQLAPQLTAVSTPAPTDAPATSTPAAPTDTLPPPATHTPSPAACLVGTWQVTNIEAYVLAAIPPQVIEEYNPTYQSTTGQMYAIFSADGKLVLQASQLELLFDIPVSVFTVSLKVQLNGTISGQYSADSNQIITSNMDTSEMTASARALEQDVIEPEQIVAAIPLVSPPFNVANYQCSGQALILTLTAYPANIPLEPPTPAMNERDSARYPVPAEEIRRENIVVNSRFIATLAPAFSVDEAKAFIARVRGEFADASHNVTVYLIGYGSSVIAHCSDAGEPPGTAGRPALEVLRGSGLGDVAVVVTRYFGGTKLGTGGLVRAYSDAVRSVIADVPRAHKVLTHTVMAGFPYRWLERVRLLVAEHHGQVLDEDFAADITLTARFAVGDFALFQQALAEHSNGSLQAEIVETGMILMPITKQGPRGA